MKPNPKAKSPALHPLNFLYSLILLVYVVVAVFTPQMEAFDSNGPKFLSVALLNLLVFAYLLTRDDFRQHPMASLAFFRSRAGMMYALLMLISLISFTKSINLSESILQFSKIITVFISCYFIAFIFLSDRRYLEQVAIGMVILLIIDNLTVYYHMGRFLKGELANIELIQSVYTNKNILAASIFVKLPFALWLYLIHTGWKQKLALAGWSISFLSLFFLSSRAFYLGILVLSIAWLISLYVIYRREKQSTYLGKMALYVGILAISALIYTVVQRNLYKDTSIYAIYNKGIIERLNSATATEYSTGERLDGWKRSWNLFKREPVLGCGPGNWKIATLQEENQTRTDLIYQYRAHNDFIEMGTETGIVGGLAFLSIFVLLMLPYVRSLFKKEEEMQNTRLLFLPAFGLGAYAVDAFFNFPMDRPEIQVLFAMFAAAGIALTLQNRENPANANNSNPANANKSNQATTNNSNPATTNNAKILSNTWKGTLLLLVLFSLYISILNFQSLKMQKIVSDEISTGRLTLSSDKIIMGFPWLPDNNIFGEPIAVQKARYLLNEKRYTGAIALLKKENSSPYDSRREYFMASAFLSLGKPDSALYYNKLVLQIKPYLLENINMMCNIYEQTGKLQETIPLLEKYLDHDKQSSKAWLMMIRYLDKSGDLKKAYACSDSAYKYMPTDASIIQNRDYQNTRLLVYPWNDSYDKAVAHYKSKEYEPALQLFTELINKEIKLPRLYEYRAFCYYFTRQYQSSVTDIDHLFSLGIRQPNMLNLRGINLQDLGKQAEACTFFKEAAQAGDQEGRANLSRYCK